MVTTGLTDELPDIPGLRELWGRDVHHCPYCHGWELDGRAVGVIGSGPRAVHQALMFRQWVDDLVLFLHSAPDLTARRKNSWQLGDQGRHRAGRWLSRSLDGHLAGVRMADGES